MATFPNTSRTQSNPAAIHNSLLEGMNNNAIELTIAPIRK